MADDPADLGQGFRRLRAVPPTPPDGIPGRGVVALVPVPSQRTLWVEELMALHRAEVGAAARSGVISAAESEQLLARLGLVIDQAVTTRRDRTPIPAPGRIHRSHAMSDVEVTYEEPLTRDETARCLSALAAALADEGEVELELGATKMKVHVPGKVRCKVEVEIDRDEIEFEVELTWPTTAREESMPPVAKTHDTADEPASAAHHSGRRKASPR
jgi:amphi-Trp domain-containing protein